MAETVGNLVNSVTSAEVSGVQTLQGKPRTGGRAARRFGVWLAEWGRFSGWATLFLFLLGLGLGVVAAVAFTAKQRSLGTAVVTLAGLAMLLAVIGAMLWTVFFSHSRRVRQYKAVFEGRAQEIRALYVRRAVTEREFEDLSDRLAGIVVGRFPGEGILAGSQFMLRSGSILTLISLGLLATGIELIFHSEEKAAFAALGGTLFTFGVALVVLSGILLVSGLLTTKRAMFLIREYTAETEDLVTEALRNGLPSPSVPTSVAPSRQRRRPAESSSL